MGWFSGGDYEKCEICRGYGWVVREPSYSRGGEGRMVLTQRGGKNPCHACEQTGNKNKKGKKKERPIYIMQPKFME